MMSEDDLIAALVEDPESLDGPAWASAEARLSADAALRLRVSRELVLDDRLARVLDPARANLAAAVRWRLDRSPSSGRFTRRVLARTQRFHDTWRVAAALAAAAALAVTVWAGLRPHERRGPARVALAGAAVELASDAVLTGDRAPTLRTGRAVFEVEPHPAGAPFVLHAPRATIIVLGTRFAVDASDTTVVAVERGRVRVVHGPDTVEVGAGERAAVGNGPGIVVSRRIAAFAPTTPAGFRYVAILTTGPDGSELASVDLPPTYSGVRLSLYDRPGGGFPTIAGQAVAVRYRLLHSVGRVALQCTDRDLGMNYISAPLPADPGRWHDVEVPLAQLRPVEPSAGAWRVGARLSNVVLYVEGRADDGLRVADVAFTAARSE